MRRFSLRAELGIALALLILGVALLLMGYAHGAIGVVLVPPVIRLLRWGERRDRELPGTDEWSPPRHLGDR